MTGGRERKKLLLGPPIERRRRAEKGKEGREEVTRSSATGQGKNKAD